MKRSKANLHYTRDITSKRVTSSGIHLRCLASEQHRNIAAVASRCRHCVQFEQTANRTPDTSYIDNGVLSYWTIRQVRLKDLKQISETSPLSWKFIFVNVVWRSPKQRVDFLIVLNKKFNSNWGKLRSEHGLFDSAATWCICQMRSSRESNPSRRICNLQNLSRRTLVDDMLL